MGFDLELEAGSAVCLRAPSGTGKSLLLRSLADLDLVDSGRLTLAGRAREDMPASEWRRAVRFVPQTPPRRPGTVADAVLEATELLGSPAQAPADLPASRDLAQLSGGEAQRLTLHLALATSPRVLLLDEPTASLDQARAGEVLELLGKYLASGGALIAATHDDYMAERLGGREVRLA
jgi:putative ABC transport system ATP-binding protein